MHEIITRVSVCQMFWIQVVQHLPVLPKVVETALWLGLVLPKATLSV